jgi:hypothetical protein
MGGAITADMTCEQMMNELGADLEMTDKALHETLDSEYSRV